MNSFTKQEWEDSKKQYHNKQMSCDVYTSMCFLYISSLEKMVNHQQTMMNEFSRCDGCEHYERTDIKTYNDICKDCSRLIRYDRFKAIK